MKLKELIENEVSEGVVNWKVKKEKLSDGSFVFNITNDSLNKTLGNIELHCVSEEGAYKLLDVLNKYTVD